MQFQLSLKKLEFIPRGRALAQGAWIACRLDSALAPSQQRALLGIYERWTPAEQRLKLLELRVELERHPRVRATPANKPARS